MNNKKNTIDEIHTETLTTYYIKNRDEIPRLTEEYNSLVEQLKQLNDNKLDEYLKIKDRLKNISKTIKTIKNERKQYLLKNSKEIFNYFEEKQKISSGNNNQNVNVLNSFFKIKSNNDDGSSIMNEKYSQSRKLYYNYWKNVNGEIPNIQNFIYSSDICDVCRKGEMIPQDEEGVLICNNIQCGKYITYITDGSKPSNKEPPNEVSYTAYIRLNHFKEILSQFQAKETTQIPPEVITAIRNRLKKERITDNSLINYKMMREILRKLELNKYFEHIAYINSIFGIKPPIMDDKLTETLCVLFIEIQKPWALYCPPNRVNFFNYTYTLYQLCVLLDQPQYLPYIPLLKDNTKQKQQDDIWKLVCRDLDWMFFPTA